MILLDLRIQSMHMELSLFSLKHVEWILLLQKKQLEVLWTSFCAIELQMQ